MKIAILGTRGIPNAYGGFEQFAEYLAVHLVNSGHEVYVYNSHTHNYKEPTWNGVNLIHCKDPEHKIGTAGQFVYDLNCIRDSRKRDFDVILQLGYTSSSVWGKLLPKASVVITNMDGLEWKRTKFSKSVQRFLKYAEKLAVKHSDYLIADSVGIQEYLQNKHEITSEYIPYGAHVFENPDHSILNDYGVKPYDYDMLIARLEPENSIEVILQGVTLAGVARDFLVFGNHETKYGEYLKAKFTDARIRFVGTQYDINVLNNLRHYSNIYFHGHTVGGTNPSLLEAMASSALICANDNEFNKYIVETDGFYFNDAADIEEVLKTVNKKPDDERLKNNLEKIRTLYNWNRINTKYEQFMEKALNSVKIQNNE